MSKRTHYLIDTKYQLRTTFSVMASVLVVTAVILGIITASVVLNSIKLNENNTRIENINKIESSMFVVLSSLTGPVQDQSMKKAIQESIRSHDRNMVRLERIIATNQDIITYNKVLVIAILIIIVLEAMALYIILIRKTHRVSGPMYVISGFMMDIIEGREPEFRPLRNSDEMQDFYELFKHMVYTIRERERRS
jgi:cytochrome bd-type quinol oxidase subunit 2